MKYASGKNALGRCQRCGDKVPYLEMVDDKQVPGLRVCQDCFDIKHPQEKRLNMDEGIVLKHPTPDGDDDSVGDTEEPLVEALGFDSYFGGST